MGSPLDHIGRACKEARERAGLHQIDIATAGNTNHATLSRFETRAILPNDHDAVIAAYAQETGVTELELWQRAIELWQTGPT